MLLSFPAGYICTVIQLVDAVQSLLEKGTDETDSMAAELCRFRHT